MVGFMADSTDHRRRNGAIAVSIEQNTLAILDETHYSQHTHDDRVAYVEAVRAASRRGIPPTYKMLEAIFGILRMGKSLELIMSSFKLLIELEKLFPRVYLSGGIESNSSGSVPQLVVDSEAWSPFTVGPESASIGRAGAKELSARPLDPSGFQLLLEDLLGAANDINVQALGLQPLRNMLLFQYLVEVLEGEHLCRCNIYKETKDWAIIREFTLNMLLGSRRINHKSVMKVCLSLLCSMHQIHSRIQSLPIALLEVEEGTSISMQKFMKMVMELDALKREADVEGYITRADGVRTALVEIILDELTYDDEIIPSFLQAFNQPKWKLEIILQYISKYIAKPTVRTRRGSESMNVGTFGGLLHCLSHVTTAKPVIRKIGVDVVQVLTSHGFQAYLGLSQDQTNGHVGSSSNSLLEICNGMISAFSNLQKTYKVVKDDNKMQALSIAPISIVGVRSKRRCLAPTRWRPLIRAMRTVVQRVESASVEVDGRIVSEIGPGLLVLVGLHEADTDADADYICRKVLNMRLFPNEATGKGWDFSVMQKNFDVLLVSQFTLFGILKGNKPDFHVAMAPQKAKPFYESLVDRFRKTYRSDRIKDGVFGAMMKVSLVNDGPVTMHLDSSSK